jgi:hypothetical protein
MDRVPIIVPEPIIGDGAAMAADDKNMAAVAAISKRIRISPSFEPGPSEKHRARLEDNAIRSRPKADQVHGYALAWRSPDMRARSGRRLPKSPCERRKRRSWSS